MSSLTWVNARAQNSPLHSQLEAPDPWLQHDNPWELPRLDVTYEIRFYGHSERIEEGKAIWSGGQEVLAIAYDVIIPGYDTKNTNNLRLWESKPKRGFDLNSFNGQRSHTPKAEVLTIGWFFQLVIMRGPSSLQIVQPLSPPFCIRTITQRVREMQVTSPEKQTELCLTVGKELRLKQQYFWTAASLADIIRRFKNLDKPITEFPDCM